MVILGAAAAASAGQVWFTVELEFEGQRALLHLPAAFQDGASTATLASGRELDLAAEAARLAGSRVGKDRRWKLEHGRGVRHTLTLSHEETEGPPATELAMSGSRGGRSFDRELPLASGELGILEVLGDGVEGRRSRGGRSGDAAGRVPWTFRIDEEGVAAVLRGWEPTVLVDLVLEGARAHVETR